MKNLILILLTSLFSVTSQANKIDIQRTVEDNTIFYEYTFQLSISEEYDNLQVFEMIEKFFNEENEEKGGQYISKVKFDRKTNSYRISSKKNLSPEFILNHFSKQYFTIYDIQKSELTLLKQL